jgi:hypothetical protein
MASPTPVDRLYEESSSVIAALGRDEPSLAVAAADSFRKVLVLAAAMSLDYATLDLLRQSHPAWRLLRSEHAPLVASFLQRVFIAPNVRVMAQAGPRRSAGRRAVCAARARGGDAFPKAALDYLNDWAANDKGWLRKFYTQGSDEPHFDLTPATEKAIAWLATLAERSFVGTESRLLTLFELLKQMSEGSETDPQARIAELQRRRDEIDAEIARVPVGRHADARRHRAEGPLPAVHAWRASC